METIKLIFTASEQSLKKISGPSETASDTVAYFVAHFNLKENWDGFDSIRAVWKNGPIKKAAVLDGEGECAIPWEVLENKGALYVNLVGSIADGEVLTDRLTTFSILALNNNKTYVDADLQEPIPSSQFEQFVEIVKDDADRAEEARDEALTAKDEAGDYALYAKDYSESAESYRDEAKGYAEDAEEASQSILGLEATASVDANVGTPSVDVSVSEVGGNKVMDFDFHNIKGEQGQPGESVDVQINGTSIVSQGVANIPVADGTTLGVVKVQGTGYNRGIILTQDNILSVDAALSTHIKLASQVANPICPPKQHEATFYGLATAAGDTTQSASANAVGEYTESAKSKISEMLNAPVAVSGSTPTITGMAGVRYVCGEVNTITITPPQSGIIDVIFECGATAATLIVPNTVKWANDFDPTSLDANTTYEINILDGVYGVVAQWT